MFMKLFARRIWNAFTLIGESEQRYDLVRAN